MRNNIKDQLLLKKAGIILIILLGVTGLTACNSKKIETVTQPEQTQEQDASQETSQKPTQNPTKETATKVPSADNQSTDADQAAAADESNKYNNMNQLATLLGLSKDELIKKVNSDYSAVDEGGLEFTQPQIRVWFDEDGKANQIFTVDTAIDFNGLKIGDDIKSFREKLGDPTKDNNGEAHFKYGDLFMLVHYDTETGKSYDVYLLNKDF